MDNFVDRVRQLPIGFKYRLTRKLAAGGWGAVYLGKDVEADAEVALKLEHHSVEESFLRTEFNVYEALSTSPSSPLSGSAGSTRSSSPGFPLCTSVGFPEVYWYGSQGEYSVMVLELLGPSLEDVLRFCGDRFSLKTTLLIADQLLQRFETLHSQNFLHRDLKPDNFLLGIRQKGNVVHMIDLGFATYFHSEETVSRASSRVRKPAMTGTARFASINGHFGGALYPSDDLEALGYMLVYFLRGSLPWQGLLSKGHGTEEERHARILKMKESVTTADLCADLPSAFAEYMDYVCALRGRQMPNHGHLRDIFKQLARERRIEYDNVFDWTILAYQRQLAERAEQQAAQKARRKAKRSFPTPSDTAPTDPRPKSPAPAKKRTRRRRAR